MASEDQKFNEFCKVLGEYYAFMKNDTYYESYQGGKFKQFCEENGYDATNIGEEFEQDPEDCMIIDFDKDDNGNNQFPLDQTDQIETKENDEESRNNKIFKILKNIYLYGHFDHYKPINIDDWDLIIDKKQIQQTSNLYKKYIHNFEQQFFTDNNLMSFLSMSPINNFPFLLSIVDCYSRDRIDYKCIHSPSMDLKEQDWIQLKPLLLQLNDKCSTIKTSSGGQLDLKSAIARYQQRIAPQFIFNPPKLINDNIKEIAVYIVSFGNFVNQLMTSQKKMPPFMIDLMFTLPPTLDSYQQYQFDDDIKESMINNGKDKDVAQMDDCIGDTIQDLKQCKCLYHQTKLEDLLDIDGEMEPLLRTRTKTFQVALREFSTKLSKHGHQTLSYPQYERFCVVIDRRNKEHDASTQDRNRNSKKRDNMIYFQPPKDCNTLPQGPYPPEIYFERGRQCLIPRPGYYEEKKDIDHKIESELLTTSDKLRQQTITTDKPSNGQLLSFSFHVGAEDNVKCYMYWSGQMIRFYPIDLCHVLPRIFINDKYENDKFNKISKDLASKMKINDPQFERFYCALSGKQPHEFPIRCDTDFVDDGD